MKHFKNINKTLKKFSISNPIESNKKFKVHIHKFQKYSNICKYRYANIREYSSTSEPNIEINETPSISQNETPSISQNETPSISQNETPSISQNKTRNSASKHLKDKFSHFINRTGKSISWSVYELKDLGNSALHKIDDTNSQLAYKIDDLVHNSRAEKIMIIVSIISGGLSAAAITAADNNCQFYTIGAMFIVGCFPGYILGLVGITIIQYVWWEPVIPLIIIGLLVGLVLKYIYREKM